MKKFTLAAVAATALFTFSANAEEAPQAPIEKNWSVGIGTYATSFGADDGYGDDTTTFSGYNFTSTYAFSDNFAVRAGYYTLEHEDFSNLESSGFDLVAYYGTGLATAGFKAYIGGGLYTDTFSVSSYEEDFSGAQLNGGLGYNWNVVALDFIMGVRSTGDYEEDSNEDITAVSASLVVSVRF